MQVQYTQLQIYIVLDQPWCYVSDNEATSGNFTVLNMTWGPIMSCNAWTN